MLFKPASLSDWNLFGNLTTPRSLWRPDDSQDNLYQSSQFNSHDARSPPKPKWRSRSTNPSSHSSPSHYHLISDLSCPNFTASKVLNNASAPELLQVQTQHGPIATFPISIPTPIVIYVIVHLQCLIISGIDLEPLIPTVQATVPTKSPSQTPPSLPSGTVAGHRPTIPDPPPRDCYPHEETRTERGHGQRSDGPITVYGNV